MELCKDCPFCLKYHPVKPEVLPTPAAEGKEDIKEDIVVEETAKEDKENKHVAEVIEDVVEVVENVAETKVEASIDPVPEVEPNAVESE